LENNYRNGDDIGQYGFVITIEQLRTVSFVAELRLALADFGNFDYINVLGDFVGHMMKKYTRAELMRTRMYFDAGGGTLTTPALRAEIVRFDFEGQDSFAAKVEEVAREYLDPQVFNAIKARHNR